MMLYRLMWILILKRKKNTCHIWLKSKLYWLSVILLEGAIASKWCNWELGLGDAKKYPSNIAIMPIADQSGSYTGSEYLQIYPVIKTEYNYSAGDYWVEWNNTKITLKDWLRK